jgi:Spy/CpxP family protein refolding chaperone
MVQLLQLTDEQLKGMDNVFERNQPKLVKLNDALKKEESILKPLLAADSVNEARIFPEVDRVAEARAELEKANARMLIELRKILTGEQWRRLQADDPEVRSNRPPPHGS